MPADGFSMSFVFMVNIPETVDFLVHSGSGIRLGPLAEEDALELGLYVFFSVMWLI